MTAPKNEVVQIEYQNPHAAAPLYLPVLVICNTPDEEIAENVRVNSARDLRWLAVRPEHPRAAVMVGGGASVKEFVEDIRAYQKAGAAIFAMNAASKWLHEQGISVDYQCIIDAKEETHTLIDLNAKEHLLGSQVHPKTMGAVDSPIVWHLETGEIERYFPEERRKRGGYALLGGGSGVGNSAVCAAYALGYRTFHIYGFDSCHQNGKSHAYEQPMNTFIPTTTVEWAGETYKTSVAMKAHAEKFQITAQALKQMGCQIHVYGDGLLQCMYNAKPNDLSEQQKYQTLWQFDKYRENSPGLAEIPRFLKLVKPKKDDLIIDFGCGTGRACVELAKSGYSVFLTDFVDNCRDEEALALPFLEWDLTNPCPATAPYGFCTDVLEHIPPEDVETVVHNIMNAAETVFFQISTVPDGMGVLINCALHLTIKPFEWWHILFNRLGYLVEWSDRDDIACQFVIKRRDLA